MTYATAVLISGQARTFKHCYPTQKFQVYRKLVNPHFFVSVSDDAQADSVEILRKDYPDRVWIERVTQPELDPEDEKRFIAAAGHASWGISVPVSAIWKQLWALNRVWEFFRGTDLERTRNHGPLITSWLRIRPDLHIHNFNLPPDCYRPGVLAPWWGSWGGIPDRMGYMADMHAAHMYFTTFHRINEMLAEGCPFHPETMLAYALERAGVKVRQTLDAEFTTIRMPGDNRPHDVPSYSNRDVFRYVNERLEEARE